MRSRLLSSIPRAVKALLIANALVFVLQLFAKAKADFKASAKKEGRGEGAA